MEGDKIIISIKRMVELVTIEGKFLDGDLVKVIRCADCKYYTDEALGWCGIHSHFDDNMEQWTMFDDDDYCSNGELKGETK